MSEKSVYPFLIPVLIIINIAGFFLRYSGYDTFFILFGFRFHFSLLISSLFLLNHIDFKNVRDIFVNPRRQRFAGLLLFILSPLLIIPLDIFLLNLFDLTNQDYFFELALSSIIDFPVYLVWNALSFFMLYLVLNTLILSSNYILLKSSFITISFFLYEIIPVTDPSDFSLYSYSEVIFLITGGLLAGLFYSHFKNIYIFALSFFSVLWINVLLFGSTSELMVNSLLAARYESWDGLINVNNETDVFIRQAHLILVFIVSILILRKDKSTTGQ